MVQLAVPERRWLPVMRHHTMQTDIMVSPETQPSVTLQGGVKVKTRLKYHNILSTKIARRGGYHP